MKLDSKYLSPIVVLPILAAIIVAIYVYQILKEKRAQYDFIITDIEVTETRTLGFKSGNREYGFFNYNVPSTAGIRRGDKIYKSECSQDLYVMRRNEQGKYVVFLKVKPQIPIPGLCDK